MKKYNHGFTLVEIMIVVSIIALLAAIAIPNLLRVKILTNDSIAKSTLKIIATASENFTVHNSGNYPSDVTSLTGATPPYLTTNFCGATVSGYSYSCTFSAGGYTIATTPVTVGTSGSTTWTITTGAILTP